MNMVQQMLCKKDFLAFCKLKNRAALKYPEYGKRVFAIYQRVWSKNRL
jgi:hypothetical protein